MALEREVLLLQCSNERSCIRALSDDHNQWSLVRFTNTESASAYLDCHSTSVAILDCSGLPEPTDSLLSFMERYKGISWVALIPKSNLDNKLWSMFVVMYCYDYHTLPVNNSRLLVTLGRAHGMHELRDMISFPVQRSNVVGKHEAIKQAFQKLYEKKSICLTLSGEVGVGKKLISKCWASAQGYSLLDYLEIIEGNASAGSVLDVRSDSFHIALLVNDVTELTKDVQKRICNILHSNPERFLFIFCCTLSYDEVDKYGSFLPEFVFYLKLRWIDIPPLRERGQDKLLLARHYLIKFNEQWGRSILGFTSGSEALILSYAWYGNVNELKERVSRAVSLCECEYIEADMLGLNDCLITSSDNDLSLKRAREKAEKNAIKRVLSMVPDHTEKAAEMLCISKSSLHRLIARYGIRR